MIAEGHDVAVTQATPEQVYELMKQLRQMGRLSSRVDLDTLKGYSPALLNNMYNGYKKQLEGSGRNQAV